MSAFVKKFADQDSQNFGGCTEATVTAACRLPLPVYVLHQAATKGWGGRGVVGLMHHDVA
jgi:hypothetical protein